MNETTLYLSSLLRELENGHDVMSVTVIESLGSAPRGAGARMLTGEKGRICGTVGGGPIEYEAEQEAGRLLLTKSSARRQYDLSSQASPVGMICGGSVKTAFHYISAGREDIKSLCRSALTLFKTPGSLWLILELPPSSGEENTGGENMWIYTPSSSVPGELSTEPAAGSFSELAAVPPSEPSAVPPSELAAAVAERCRLKQPGIITCGEQEFYLELISADSLVHLFGGGHVARELVPLLSKSGFSCAVYDDREEYLKQEDFPDAFGTAVVSFDKLEGCLFPAAENYFVIMTRGHVFDLQAQAFAMKSPAAYIGVMGSRKKKAYLTEALLKAGFSREELDFVHAPIGLDIGADTPAEIAVSIAAELIQVRSLRSVESAVKKEGNQ
ncbi:XdhC family protein [Clostridium transplantifaecale]|uniref:XdhC family protein n=1 Tax=Clostridium transplantifaecale TaxID=2479838 RepID=UPI000F6443B0|nr:XdhC/CoxI family protein [Clostridium transplantifaecale]